MKARILIVEDHPLVSDATKALLLTYDCSNEVTIVASAAEVLSISQSDGGWNLILLDLDVPGAHGFSLAREIAARGLAAKTCIVTALSRANFAEEAKALRFLGFIPKACPLSVFSNALKEVLEGRPAFPEIAESSHIVGGMPRLTRRQQCILELLAQGLSSKQMAKVLDISEGTVNNHVAATLRVLGATNRLQAFRRAIEVGLIRHGDVSLGIDPSSCAPASSPT